MGRMIIGMWLVGLALLLGASDAFADRGDRAFRLGWISEQLDLDPGTAAAVDAVISETEPEAKELRRRKREERRALGELLSADPPDVEAVMAQVDRLGAAKTAADKHRIRTMLRIRSLLTPEQRAKLASMEGPGRWAPKAFEVCKADLASFCADEGPGRPAIRCLRTHREELSEACREALPKGRRGFHRDRDRGRDRGPRPGGPEGPPPGF